VENASSHCGVQRWPLLNLHPLTETRRERGSGWSWADTFFSSLAHKVCRKLPERIEAKNHALEVMEQIVHSIQSFAVHGFTESHASALRCAPMLSPWYRAHRAAEFCADLPDNQSMG